MVRNKKLESQKQWNRSQIAACKDIKTLGGGGGGEGRSNQMIFFVQPIITDRYINRKESYVLWWEKNLKA